MAIRIAGTVERAFELAAESSTLEEVRQKLRREGYAQIDEHLGGNAIRGDLRKLLRTRHFSANRLTSVSD